MKKLFVFLCLLLVSINVFSATLEDIYYRDYGIIDRVVLVFDKKVEFNITENGNDVEVSILNCTIGSKAVNEEFVTNKVLQSFEFIQFADDVIAVISAKSLVKTSDFSFIEKNKNFKVVLDIFAVAPVSYEENVSYAEFHQTVGNEDLAKKYYIQAEALKNNPPPKEEKPKKKEKKEKKKKETNPIPKSSKPFKLPVKPQYLFAFIFVILLIFVIIVLIKKKGKSGKSKKDDFEFESTDGFGNTEFREEMLFQLIEADWDDENIAKELQISVKEVERFRKKL
jgi:hypothetical protein